MDGKTVRETVTSTGRELVNLKSVAKLVPVAIALGGAYGCVNPVSGQQTSPEATPTANTLINVEILRTKEPTAVPNPELIVPALDFQQAATDGKLVYMKLDANNQPVGAQTGDLGDVISGNFDTPKKNIPQSVVEQIALPSAQSVIVIKMGEKNLPIKMVRVPTTRGVDKVILFGKFDGGWKQILLADGDQGLNISSGKDGVIVDGMNRLNLAFDSQTNPTFQALLALNNPGTTDQFFSALYPNINGGKLELIYREQGNVIRGNLPEGLFEIKNSTGATKILASMAADLATPAAPTAPSPTPTNEPLPMETPGKTAGYYFPEVKEGLPNVPIIPIEVYKKQMMRVEDVAAVRYNPDTKRVQAVNDKGILLAEAAWVEKTMDDGSKQLVWEWGTPFVKTDKGTELRGPTEELKKEAIGPFIGAMKTIGVDLSAEQVGQGLTAKEYVDYYGKPLYVLIYNLVPDPIKSGESMGTQIPIFSTENNGDWNYSIKNLADRAGFKIGAEALRGVFTLMEDQLSQMTITAISLKRMSRDGTFDLSISQGQLEKAIANNQVPTFLHLVYSNPGYLPDWLTKGSFTKEEYIKIFDQFIVGAMTSNRQLANKLAQNNPNYPNGKVTLQYSVVNEAAQSTFWRPKVGSDYVERAFRVAREADPEAVLIYNDYGHELPNLPNANKVFSIVKELKDQGLVDGVGMQMHFLGAPDSPDPNKPITDLEKGIRSQIDRYAKIGVKVYITELDVDLSKIRGTPVEKLKKAFEIYRLITHICADYEMQVSAFGVNSKDSWINELGGKGNLLFEDNQPTASFYGAESGLLAHFDALP